MKREPILAVRTAGLPPSLLTTGFHAMDSINIIATLEAAGLWIGPRYQLEEDEAFLQVIPYVVLKHRGSVAMYVRGEKGGEKRLHGLASIGIGGHIEDQDVHRDASGIFLSRTLWFSACREVDEEIGATGTSRDTWIGLLLDRTAPVGRVHIGVVGIWKIDQPITRAAEDAIKEVRMVPIRELPEHVSALESWSTMLVPELVGRYA